MLRTLGGKNIGKCRLRAHQHPLLPPLPNLRQAHPHVKHPRQDASSTRDERVLGDVLRDLLRVRAEDGLLRASILDFKPRLGNRCRVLPVYALFRASILDFKPRLANRCSAIVAAQKNGPPVPAVSTLRVRIYSFLRQIGMVPPAAAVATTTFCVRF